ERRQTDDERVAEQLERRRSPWILAEVLDAGRHPLEWLAYGVEQLLMAGAHDRALARPSRRGADEHRAVEVANTLAVEADGARRSQTWLRRGVVHHDRFGRQARTKPRHNIFDDRVVLEHEMHTSRPTYRVRRSRSDANAELLERFRFFDRAIPGDDFLAAFGSRFRERGAEKSRSEERYVSHGESYDRPTSALRDAGRAPRRASGELGCRARPTVLVARDDASSMDRRLGNFESGVTLDEEAT
ncbi:MAG TPA: hypothetical protein VFL30_11370, partial [Rhodanobacteraceae bacterium]|nr:hypothetical protein [Rhodanobacteraceae bacterium]